MKHWQLAYVVFVVLLLAGCVTASDKEADNSSTEPLPVVDPVEFGIDTAAGLPHGLSIGTKAPGFAASDQNGKQFDLYSELKESPMVVMFYRGKWCPHCTRHMSNLNDSILHIFNTGAKIVAITPELKPNAQDFSQMTNTEFPILSDPGNNIMKAFDVSFTVTSDYQNKIESNMGTSIAGNNGQSEARLPVPATYIIDNSGTIRYVHFDYNYRKRPTVKEIVDAVKNMR